MEPTPPGAGEEEPEEIWIEPEEPEEEVVVPLAAAQAAALQQASQTGAPLCEA